MERRRDGEGELRDLKDLEGGGRVVGEEVFQAPTAFTTTSLLFFFFFFLFCEPQRKASSEEGPPPTKTKAKQKTSYVRARRGGGVGRC